MFIQQICAELNDSQIRSIVADVDNASYEITNRKVFQQTAIDVLVKFTVPVIITMLDGTEFNFDKDYYYKWVEVPMDAKLFDNDGKRDTSAYISCLAKANPAIYNKNAVISLRKLKELINEKKLAKAVDELVEIPDPAFSKLEDLLSETSIIYAEDIPEFTLAEESPVEPVSITGDAVEGNSPMSSEILSVEPELENEPSSPITTGIF